TRLRLRVQLVQIPDTAVVELPAVLQHFRAGVVHRDRLLQSLQRAHDQRAVRPRTGFRDVEAVAAGFHLADPAAKRALRTDECATRRRGIARHVAPDSLYQHPHGPEYSSADNNAFSRRRNDALFYS